MRSSTHCLSSVTASTYMFVESSDSWSSHSAIVAMANQPKICCAYDSAIEIAAFPTARVQHAKSLMPFALQSHTQHSSERNIGRQRDRELGAIGMSKADVSGRGTCDARGPQDAASGALLADRTVDERDGRRVSCSGWTPLIVLLQRTSRPTARLPSRLGADCSGAVPIAARGRCSAAISASIRAARCAARI